VPAQDVDRPALAPEGERHLGDGLPAVKRGEPHPIYTFLEHGVPVAVCTDNTTVSNTDQTKENLLLRERLSLKEIEAIHVEAARHSFIRRVPVFAERRRHLGDGNRDKNRLLQPKLRLGR